jgi:hypothetical protein
MNGRAVSRPLAHDGQEPPVREGRRLLFFRSAVVDVVVVVVVVVVGEAGRCLLGAAAGAPYTGGGSPSRAGIAGGAGLIAG